MNEQKEQLARLLRAAAKAPREPASPAPFGFATRTFAEYKQQRSGAFAMAAVCRRAVWCSFAAVVVAGVFACPALVPKSQPEQFIGQLSASASRIAMQGLGSDR